MDPHFVFAKTVADTPHYWVKRTPENKADYVALYNAIRDHGVSEGLGRHQTPLQILPPRRLKALVHGRDLSEPHINQARVDDAEASG
jgi:hypothetical protein